MIVMLYFDSGYYYWASVLIGSFAVHEPEAKFTLYTFNLSKQQIDELNSFSSVLYVENMVMKFDPKIATKWLYQLVCRKGKFLLDTMNRFENEKLFISMDVDMMLVQELGVLKKKMKNYDVGFVWVNINKIMSGFIAVSNTDNAKKYLEEYYKRAMIGKLKHENDQPTLAKIYEEKKNDMSFLLLSRKYLDSSAGKDAYVWSAHKSVFGPKKERHKKYLKKLKYMENE